MSRTLRIFRSLLKPRLVVYPILVVVTLAVGTLEFLRSNLGNELIRTSIEQFALNSFPNLKLKMGNLETDILTEIEIKDLSLRVRGEEDPAITVESIALDWDVIQLVQKNKLRSFIYISGIDVIAKEDRGQLNLEKLFDTGEPPAPETETTWPELPLDLEIPIIDIDQTTLHWENAEITTEMEASLNWNEGENVDLQLQRIQAHMPEIGDLASRIAISGNSQLIDLDISLQQENRGLTLQGKIEDVIGEGKLQIESKIHCQKSCLKDFTAQDIPQIDQEIAIQIGGNFSEIKTDLMIGKIGEFPLKAKIIPAEEVWDASWNWKDFKINDWVGDLEPITLQGEYSVQGNGFSYEENMQVTIQGEAPVQEIWNERLEFWKLQAKLDKGQLAIERFLVGHSMGEIAISGDLNLLESQGQLQAGLDIRDFQYLEKFDVHNIEGQIGGTPVFHVNWADEPKIQLQGNLELQNMKTEFGAFQRMESQLDGDIDAEKAVLRLQHQITNLDSTGILISTINAGTDIEAEFSGKTRVDGEIHADQTTVEEGVVVLHDLQGKFAVEMEEELFFETKDMLVGELELVPIQYKIDGGPVSIQLKDDNLIADLHLLRKQKTFIDVQAKSDLTNGTWWVNRLTLSPTEGKEWGLTEGMIFQLSDKGVEDFKLELVSSAGEISIFADTNNNSPDFAVEVKDFQVEYAVELAEIFGTEGIPAGSSGLIQGMIHIRGENGKFGEEDFLMVQKLHIPELAENIDIGLDIKGQLDKPKLRLVANSAENKDELLRLDGYWPLNLEDGFAVNCDEYGNIQLVFSETNWKKWQPYFPTTPDLDVYLGLQLKLKGKACEPSVQISGMARMPMGAKKPNIRADWQAIFDEGRLNFSATVEEKLQPIFLAEGEIQTGLEKPIAHFLKTMEWKDPEELVEFGEMRIQPNDLHLDRILPLADMDGIMSGEITGEISLKGNLDSLNGGGDLFLKDGQIGTEPIEKFTLHLDLDQTEADITIDSEIGKAGIIDLTAKIPFEEGKELNVSGEINDVPFAIAEAFVPDIQNARGRLSTGNSLKITGTLDEPLVNVNLEGKDISFQHQYLGTKYKNVQLLASLEKNQINLQNLSGEITSIQSFNPLLEDDWGKFALTGTVATGDTLQSRWNLTFDDCTLIDNQMAHLVVSGEINALQKKNVHFKGDLFVHKGRTNFGKDFFTDSASLDLNPRFKIHRTGAVQKDTTDSMAWLKPILDEMEGNVGVDLGDRISIKAELPMAEEYGQSFASLASVKVETDLRGKINAGWKGGEPQMTGTISTIRGSFETMGRDFDIEEGEIVFTGGEVYNPRLNLTAQKTFGSYGDIIVRVGGTVEDMTIDFESENAPESYDQTDILSLILLGKPAREMADSESQTSSLLLTAGLKTMGGVVGDALGGHVVDEIDWDPSEDMFQIGKSLNDTMFLSYTKIKEPDEGENQNQITLEWLILNRVYMEFITGDANNSQVTLYYRWIF